MFDGKRQNHFVETLYLCIGKEGKTSFSKHLTMHQRKRQKQLFGNIFCASAKKTKLAFRNIFFREEQFYNSSPDGLLEATPRPSAKIHEGTVVKLSGKKIGF